MTDILSMNTTLPTPPDPDEMNLDRAMWALEAVTHFQKRTGTDAEDAIADLLCDLMHLCDRTPMLFEQELDRAMRYYKGETYEPQ